MAATRASSTIFDTFGSDDAQGPNWSARLVRPWGRWNGLGHAGFLPIDIDFRPTYNYAIYDLAAFS
jgi:hypothetical protein